MTIFDTPIHVVSISDENQITVDGRDIITGEVKIAGEQSVQVIKVIEKGPKGDKGEKGEKGDTGASGVAIPFYEVVSGDLYESSASISVSSDLKVSGSTYINETLSVGEDIVSAPPARLTVIGNATSSMDIISFGNQQQDFMTINYEGVTVFGEISGSQPTPIAGGLYYSGDGFYVGI